MVGFGANVTGFNFINYFARSGDNLLIGWWWGAQPLGFYELAYRLMMAPLRQLSYPLQQVMIPALSRLQGEPERYRRAYFQAVGVLQVISCPLMGFVAVTAPQIVEFVFGPGYEPAGPILRWLAIAGLIQPISVSLGWLYVSQGRTREMLRWGLLGCTLIVISFFIGLPWGPLGVARAYAGMICLIIAPLAFWFAGAVGPVNRMDLAKLCGAVLIWTLPTIASTTFVLYFIQFPSVIVGLCVSGAASVLVTLLLTSSSSQGRTTLSQVRELAGTVFRPCRSSIQLRPSSEDSSATSRM